MPEGQGHISSTELSTLERTYKRIQVAYPLVFIGGISPLIISPLSAHPCSDLEAAPAFLLFVSLSLSLSWKRGKRCALGEPINHLLFIVIFKPREWEGNMKSGDSAESSVLWSRVTAGAWSRGKRLTDDAEAVPNPGDRLSPCLFSVPLTFWCFSSNPASG